MKLSRRFLVFAFVGSTNAFSIQKPELPCGMRTRLAYSVHDEDKPIECFLIYHNDEEDYEGPPQVVCTSQPDEYAWFNGIDRENLIKTDGMHDGALQCVEGASPRGVPEWECESTFQ